jgi:hypothetical protein
MLSYLVMIYSRVIRREIGDLENGYEKLFTLYSISLPDILRLGNGFFIAVVPDGNVGTSFGKSMGNGKPNSCPGAGDDCCTTLERKQREHTPCVGGRASIVMDEISTVHDLIFHFEALDGG